jgi:hypothetical protein
LIRSVFLSILFLAALLPSSAQLLINEFSASNSGNIVDPEYGNSADWIELFNSGDDPVNINGYTITDNYSQTDKWRFTTNLIIQPDEYLLIWCDGMALDLHTSFKLAAEGEEIALFDAQGLLQDSISYAGQESNISMGRVCDGCTDWVFFTEATPGATNSGMNYLGLVQNEPLFSPLGGIFQAPVMVTLQNLFPGELRYTTDGTEPTTSSPLYLAPIAIDTTTILRARIFQGDQIRPGRTITHSYFIDTHGTIGSLPVVSLVSEPENFWGAEKGIYVQNFKPEWEIPVNIELFENDGSDRAGFNLPAGTKVNGLYSWQLPQKMLGIYFRKRYGAGSLDYPLFPDKKAVKYDSFALRASGNDWSRTLFRDALLQNATQLTTDVDIQGYRPCVVYINGRYMGIHNIRSKVDADFIVNEQLPGDTQIDMIENEKVVEEGSLDAYNQFKALYSSDLSVQSNYDAVAQAMDIPLFMDYMSTELYGGNSSVGHNVMAWKPVNDGKWKWILIDLDRSLFDPDEYLTDFFLGKSVYPFPALMKNNGFATQLGRRLADHLMTTFNPQRMDGYIDSYADRIRDELPRHIQRWEGTSSSYGDPIPSVSYWETSMTRMKTFAYQRPVILLNDFFSFTELLPLSLGVRPARSATLYLNSLKAPLPSITGNYPAGSTITLSATPHPGYKLQGWKLLSDTTLIQPDANWKYADTGAINNETWKNINFDDSNWEEGQAELGYGDGDETTKVSYGNSSSNKHISTYFRKTLHIDRINSLDLFRISMKIDDGAVVYINGKEAARFNIATGKVSPTTLAAASVPNATIFQDWIVPAGLFQEGTNIIAVEVHQNASNSSDISFKLGLKAGTLPSQFYSTQTSVDLTLSQARSALAVYEDMGLCMLPDTISEELTLSKECSPYYSRGDVVVSSTGKLIAGEGIEIRMAPDASLYVYGSLRLRGSADKPVRIVANSDNGPSVWGAIIARNASDTILLDHLVLEDASRGTNPITENAAISLFNSTGYFNHLNLTNINHNPILARYSDITLRNSELHSKVTGDFINVKYGKGRIENCIFRGNNQPDTDAIDYDNVDAGTIRTSMFHDFHGSNSDAIDIGERAQNIQIDSVFIYNITDKGVSVGQQSSVRLSNSYFVNCNLGIAVKDSSHLSGDRLTFYGCNTPVAAYEKNIGQAGGNILINRSVLSNANDQLFEADDKSTLHFLSSYADHANLPDSTKNYTIDPLFVSPNTLNFSLKDNSGLVDKDGNQLAGADHTPHFALPAMPLITSLYIGDADAQDAELILIENPGTAVMDLSGYRFINGIEATLPSLTLLNPGERLFLTNLPQDLIWAQTSTQHIYPYSAGRLNNGGEKLAFATASGIIVDQLEYSPLTPWPPFKDQAGMAVRLKDNTLDNHFGYNWELIDRQALITGIADEELEQAAVTIFPNPASDYLTVTKNTAGPLQLSMYSLTGNCVYTQLLHESGRINLSQFSTGVYILRLGESVHRLIIRR